MVVKYLVFTTVKMVINLTESPQSPIVISSSSGRSSSHISKTRKSSSPSSSYDLPLAELQRRIKGKARKKSSSPSSSYDLPLAELRRRLPGRQTTTETFPPGLDVTVAGKGDDPATVTAAAIVPGTTAGDTSVVFKFDHQPRRLQDVQALAQELIQKYVPHYRFEFDERKIRAGATKFGEKVVSVSRRFAQSVQVPNHAVRDTILHEVAHAMAGYAAAHGPVWKRQAVAIGCTGDRCHTFKFTAAKYRLKCPCGANDLERHQLPKGFLQGRWHRECARCHKPLKVFKQG